MPGAAVVTSLNLETWLMVNLISSSLAVSKSNRTGAVNKMLKLLVTCTIYICQLQEDGTSLSNSDLPVLVE